jgi:hypothetical protein
MGSHTKHLETIKNAIKDAPLNEDEKSESMKRIEEWVLEDKAFGTFKNELLEISEYFEVLFAELGLTK